MPWRLQFFPVCTHHVFLSHCREDRDSLVVPLYETLQKRGGLPWLDRHDYPYGRRSYEALRDGVLRCRHTVFLVTRAMLTQPRGWTILELAWADLLQENLREPGGELQAVAFPLFFVGRDSEGLLRSAWLPVRDRGVFCPPKSSDRVAWAAERVVAFLRQGEARGVDIASWLEQDSRARSRLSARPGILDRITCRNPTPLLAAE
ncbi:MAG: toll/interleukin-1 receptor domain-containing protein [Planctomycetota bacterium]